MQATVSATAYLLPADQGLTDGASTESPTGTGTTGTPAAPTTPSNGGSAPVTAATAATTPMTFFRDLSPTWSPRSCGPWPRCSWPPSSAIPTKLTKHESTGGGTAAADASGQRAAREVSEAQPVVQLASDEEGHTDSVRGLSAHDPFAPRKAKSASTTSSQTSAAGSNQPSSSGGTGGGSTGGTAPQPTPKKKSSTQAT